MPLNDPVPSTAADVLERNAQDFDRFVVGAENTFVTRLGVEKPTVTGIIGTANEAIANIQADGAAAINALRVVNAGSFEDGATLTARNEVLYYLAEQTYYRWDGALPKTVPPASTPSSTGGVGVGAWVDVGDAALRSDLADFSGTSKVAGGVPIYRESYQSLIASGSEGLIEGQLAQVRGTGFTWSGGEWKPTGKIYVNSWGARGDAPFRENGTGTNSRQAFIDAADYAHRHGHKYVFAEPGIYYAPDLLASEMHDLYVVGDEVQFTHANLGVGSNSGHAQIQALTTQDYSNGVGWGSRKNTGRGRIAFEFDDSHQTQFSILLPLFKKYGVPYGIAYHTSYVRPWIREVFRHGNEILAHFPDNIDSTKLTRQQLEDNATADLDAIEAITGYRDGVNFVYPMHYRNAETDDVLSQFYASGRGLASGIMSTPSFFGGWPCSAWAIDNNLTSGNLSTIFSRLKTLRDNDLDLVLYGHDISATKANNLEKIIKYALHLGIEITLPRNLKPTHQMLSDRYFKDFENYTGSGEWDTSVHSEFGTRSRKFSYTGTGNVSPVLIYQPIRYIRSKKDFSKIRVSFLYKTAQDLVFPQNSTDAGIVLRTTYWRVSGGGADTSGGLSSTALGLPMPSSDFDNRISFYVYVPRTISRIQFGIGAAFLVQPAEFWIDDLRVEKIDEVDSVYLRGTLRNMGALGTRPVPDDTAIIGEFGVDFASSYSAISTMEGTMRRFGLLPGTTENELDEGKAVQAVVSLIRGHTG